ncbi:hypothetical protein Patl1_35960 [Pistacia atlantica]|nr:hypothetical protein Patl1_35960 [Pistacia atlantica]
MRTYVAEISDQTIVAKVLRSLTPKFGHLVAAIEESKDLESHEARLTRANEKNEEKAFQVRGEASNQNEEKEVTSRGRGRGGFRGRGGHGRRRGDEQNDETQQLRGNRSGVQCYYCKRFGHVKAECWKLREKQASYAEQKEEEVKLFMAYHVDTTTSNNIWFLDSGCSNHMTGIKSLFTELDESYKLKVRLGDDKQMQVEGKGTVAINNGHGNVKLLYNVYFIPYLSQNLLSVGQLMASGHFHFVY